jgi:PEGA domain-containing protein
LTVLVGLIIWTSLTSLTSLTLLTVLTGLTVLRLFTWWTVILLKIQPSALIPHPSALFLTPLPRGLFVETSPVKESWTLRPAAINLLICLGSLALISGCVRSKVEITTEPPEAEITMNGVNLGNSPVDQPFAWYWYYDFTAAKEGYEPGYKRRRFHAPPWLWPGFDLLMEAMPFYVTDTKKVHLVLEESQDLPDPAFAFEEGG